MTRRFAIATTQLLTSHNCNTNQLVRLFCGKDALTVPIVLRNSVRFFRLDFDRIDFAMAAAIAPPPFEEVGALRFGLLRFPLIASLSS